MDQSLRRVPMSPHAYDPDSDPEDDADERKEKEPVDEAPQEPITPAEPLTTVHHANIDEPSPRHPSVDYDFEAQTKAKQIKACVIELLEGKIQFFSAADKENFGFLADTIDLVLAYLSAQSQLSKAIPAYYVLLRAFVVTLEDTLSSILKIKRREGVMTDSFEVFELAIRRYLEQFGRMFPPDAVVPPASVISDSAARALWVRHFGAEQHYVSFELFEHAIIAKEFPLQQQKLTNFFRLFLNFPQDDLITTYKWNNITRLFGPYPEFVENFSAFALGRGFLGLINRVRAREMLLLEPGSNPVYLVRFSRTVPDYLAFSYRSAGSVSHVLNRGDNGDVIPIKAFLAKRFNNFAAINKAVNVDAVIGTKNLQQYSSGYASGYVSV